MFCRSFHRRKKLIKLVHVKGIFGRSTTVRTISDFWLVIKNATFGVLYFIAYIVAYYQVKSSCKTQSNKI